MLIVYWPITIKFRIRKLTSKPQTNYRCCLRFSYLAPYWLISRKTITFHKYFWCSRFCKFHNKSNIKKMRVTFLCQQRFVEEHVNENVPTFKGGNYTTHEEMSSVVIFICQGYKPLELTGYRIIWLKISGMPLGKKSWSEYFFLLSKPARTIPRFQVNRWKGNLSPFTILLCFDCRFPFLSFFAPKDKVTSFISIVKDCPLNRTGVAFQMPQRCFHCCHGCKHFLVVTLPL